MNKPYIRVSSTLPEHYPELETSTTWTRTQLEKEICSRLYDENNPPNAKVDHYTRLQQDEGVQVHLDDDGSSPSETELLCLLARVYDDIRNIYMDEHPLRIELLFPGRPEEPPKVRVVIEGAATTEIRP